MYNQGFLSRVQALQQTDISRRTSSCSESTHNSFLIEVDNNSDIDDNIRYEINTRYNRSIVNATYKFPRISYHPFPSISLQQKYTQREQSTKKVLKKSRPFKLISHTPKPSLNKSIKISKKHRKGITPSPDFDNRTISITPTPMSITGKLKRNPDFPKLRMFTYKTPTLNFKNFKINY